MDTSENLDFPHESHGKSHLYTGLLFLKADLQQKQVKFLQLSSNNI